MQSFELQKDWRNNNKGMKENFYGFLKGKFLVDQDAVKNWGFILFCTFLAIVMIASSHSAERKVHDIARLNEEVRELQSEFVHWRSSLMRMKMESTITRQLKDRGIGPSDTPPSKIRINQQDHDYDFYFGRIGL